MNNINVIIITPLWTTLFCHEPFGVESSVKCVFMVGWLFCHELELRVQSSVYLWLGGY